MRHDAARSFGSPRRFPALSRTGEDGRPVIYADAPGGSQVPETVIDAIAGHLRSGISNTHGAFAASEETDALIAEARRAAADITGADPGEIVFGPNSTTLLLHLSRSFGRTLGPGDEVVVTKLDHDANVRPWVLAAEDAGATVRWVDIRDDDVTLDLESFDAALTDRTRLVAFTLASNARGHDPAGRRADPPRPRRGCARRGRRRALRAAPRARSARSGRRHPGVLAVQVLRAAPGRAERASRAARDVDAVQAPPGAGRRARAVGDGHPEPRGTRRLDRRRRLPGGRRPDVRRPAGGARRDAVVAGFAAIGAHERGLAAPLPARRGRHPGRSPVGHRRRSAARRTDPDVRGPRRRSGPAEDGDRTRRGAASTSGTGTTTRSP